MSRPTVHKLSERIVPSPSANVPGLSCGNELKRRAKTTTRPPGRNARAPITTCQWVGTSSSAVTGQAYMGHSSPLESLHCYKPNLSWFRSRESKFKAILVCSGLS